MARVEVVMDEKALQARYMLNFKLVKLSWHYFSFSSEGAGYLRAFKKLITPKNGELFMQDAA